MDRRKKRYVDAKTFKELSQNQDKLIEILNHRMTSIELNVAKLDASSKMLKWVLGYIAVIITGGMGIILNSLL